MIYTVSYVVIGVKHPGAIRSQHEPPRVGGRVRIGRETFEVIEVQEIMPPRDDFQFLHATLRPIQRETQPQN